MAAVTYAAAATSRSEVASREIEHVAVMDYGSCPEPFLVPHQPSVQAPRVVRDPEVEPLLAVDVVKKVVEQGVTGVELTAARPVGDVLGVRDHRRLVYETARDDLAADRRREQAYPPREPVIEQPHLRRRVD